MSDNMRQMAPEVIESAPVGGMKARIDAAVCELEL